MYVVQLFQRLTSSARSAFDLSPPFDINLVDVLNAPVDFTIHGIGIRYFPDGKRYQGGFVYGKREGKGVLFNKGNILYDGYWKADKREGEGMGVDTTGNVYEGQWKADKYHGKGTLTMKEKKVQYNGEWINGTQEGEGTMIFFNEDGSVYNRYDGQWKNNKRHGNGVYNWVQAGTRYEGSWVNDKQEGKGIITFANGDKYIGDWKRGQRHGMGKMIYANEDIYEGEWKEDKLHGKGVFIVAREQGRKFEGQFKLGLRIEAGVKRWPDGTVYEEVEDKPTADSAPSSPRNSIYKDSIVALLNQFRATPAALDSWSFVPVEGGNVFSKAIDQIKRKNSVVP
jgi:hypothetical protein